MNHILSIENIHPDPITVYTDGACSNNGRKNARAGIGIYFGQNDSRNVSCICPGKQTNNVAELTSIIKTYFILEKEINEDKSYVLIVSDSNAIRHALRLVKNVPQKNGKIKNQYQT